MPLVPGDVTYASERLVTRVVTQHATTLSIVAAAEPLLDGGRQHRLHAATGRGPLAGDSASGLRMEIRYAQRAYLLVQAHSAPARRQPTGLAAQAPPPRRVEQPSWTKLAHAMVAQNADMVAGLPDDIGDDQPCSTVQRRIHVVQQLGLAPTHGTSAPLIQQPNAAGVSDDSLGVGMPSFSPSVSLRSSPLASSVASRQRCGRRSSGPCRRLARIRHCGDVPPPPAVPARG